MLTGVDGGGVDWVMLLVLIGVVVLTRRKGDVSCVISDCDFNGFGIGVGRRCCGVDWMILLGVERCCGVDCRRKGCVSGVIIKSVRGDVPGVDGGVN